MTANFEEEKKEVDLTIVSSDYEKQLNKPLPVQWIIGGTSRLFRTLCISSS